MCGRGHFAQLAIRRLEDLSQYDVAEAAEGSRQKKFDEHPRHTIGVEHQASFAVIENACPGMFIPVLIRNKESIDGDKAYRVESMKWGLNPKFTSSPNFSSDQYSSRISKLFNKRIETLVPSKGYFHSLADHNRCVIVFDGIYEWTGVPGNKQPHYLYHVDHEPFMLAGFYEDSKEFDQNINHHVVVRTFTIITQPASKQFSVLHQRQPVMLTLQQVHAWLDPNNQIDDMLNKLRHNPKESELSINANLASYAVTKQMSRGNYQESDVISPVETSEDEPEIHPLEETIAGRKRKLASPPNSSSRRKAYNSTIPG